MAYKDHLTSGTTANKRLKARDSLIARPLAERYMYFYLRSNNEL